MPIIIIIVIIVYYYSQCRMDIICLARVHPNDSMSELCEQVAKWVRAYALV